MQYYRHFVKYSTYFLLFTFWLLNSCEYGSEDITNGGSIGGPLDTVEGLPADPGEGNLAGKVVGTLYGEPLAGVTVSVNFSSTVTDSEGNFLLLGVGEGNLAVVLSGDGIYSRTKALNTELEGRSVSIDVIEQSSSFSLTFYRQIARGNHPLERDMFPTHRWASPIPPTFYINTNAEAAEDGEIGQQTVDATIGVLREIAPVFTGNFYNSIRIETRYFPRDVDVSQIPENSFVISFDDSLQLSGAYGLTYTLPDFISPTTSTINKAFVFVLDNERYYKAGDATRIAFEEIVAHESGHGFGFRHTAESRWGGLPSVMVKTGEYGGTYSLHDQLHMAIVYSRPAGNTDIDNDPLTADKAHSMSFGPQIFIDRRAERPLSEQETRSLSRLQSFDIVRELLEQEGLN